MPVPTINDPRGLIITINVVPTPTVPPATPPVPPSSPPEVPPDDPPQMQDDCGGYGIAPEGAMGFGAEAGVGIGAIPVLAVPILSGLIEVTLDSADPDALDPLSWTVSDGINFIAVVIVQHVGGLTYRLFLAAPMIPGVTYTVTFVCGGSIGFENPIAPAGIEQPAPFDVANPQLVRDAGLHDPPPLGQLQVNDRGDFGLDNRIQNLRKRILRRLSTFRGGFALLPDYGAAQGVKNLLLPGTLQTLAAEIESQIKREPEVVAVRVSVVRTALQVVTVSVSARTITGLDVAAAQTLDLRAAV